MHLKHALFVGTLVFLALPAAAEPIQKFLQSPVFGCAEHVIFTDEVPTQDFWVLSGPDTGHLTLDIYRHILSRKNWRHSQLTTIDVRRDGSARVGTLQIEGLLSATPTVTELDRSGHPRKNCERFTLEPALAPSALYDAALKQLAVDPPEPADMAKANKTLDNLPPFDSLDALDRDKYDRKISTATQVLKTRFQENLKSRIADLGDTSLQPEMVSSLIANAKNRDRFNMVGRLEHEINARARALFLAGKDPAREAVQNSADLCERVDGFALGGGHNLETEVTVQTGLPFAFWSKDLVQSWQKMAESCKEGKTFANLLNDAWPRAAKSVNGTAFITAWRDKIYAQKVTTVAQLEQANWFWPRKSEFQSDYFGTGDQVNAYLKPIVDERRDRAMAIIVEGISANLSKHDLSPKDILGYCDALLGQYASQSDSTLGKQLYTRCVAASVAPAKAALANAIDQAGKALQSFDLSARGFVETDGYTVQPVLGPSALGKDSTGELARFQTARLEQANEMLEDKAAKGLQLALADLSKRMQPALQNGAAMDQAARQMCQDVSSASRAINARSELSTLAQRCDKWIQDYAAKSKARACSRKMTEAGIPKDLHGAYITASLPLFGTRAISMQDLVCNPVLGAHVTLTSQKGWFASSYRLSNKSEIQGKTVTISATLTPAKNGGAVMLSDPKISGGEFDKTTFDLSSSLGIAGCLIDINDCRAR